MAELRAYMESGQVLCGQHTSMLNMFELTKWFFKMHFYFLPLFFRLENEFSFCQKINYDNYSC